MVYTHGKAVLFEKYCFSPLFERSFHIVAAFTFTMLINHAVCAMVLSTSFLEA
jgi:hypothetical protein